MMTSVTYNAKKDAITVVYDDNFGRVREEDVTVQALDAVFDYFMSKGLSFAEHCEYTAFGRTYRVSLVKGTETSTDSVKQGHWIVNNVERYVQTTDENGDADIEIGLVDQYECSVCHSTQSTLASDWNYCPVCGTKMDNNASETQQEKPNLPPIYRGTNRDLETKPSSSIKEGAILLVEDRVFIFYKGKWWKSDLWQTKLRGQEYVDESISKGITPKQVSD